MFDLVEKHEGSDALAELKRKRLATMLAAAREKGVEPTCGPTITTSQFDLSQGRTITHHCLSTTFEVLLSRRPRSSGTPSESTAIFRASASSSSGNSGPGISFSAARSRRPTAEPTRRS
jgi:hypothetical protein